MSGLVRDMTTDLPVPGATARLSLPRPQQQGAGAYSERQKLLKYETKTNEHGFFQLAGLEAGIYSLEVVDVAHAPATMDEIEVSADRETFVEEVVLGPYVELGLRIRPERDFDGKPWTVSLREPQGNIFVVRQADLRGEVWFNTLVPGRVHVIVQSGTQTVAFEQVELRASEVVEVSLDLVGLHGSIQLGDEPLAATLVLLTGEGDAFRFTSNEEGQFFGWMNEPSKEWLRVRVEATAPMVRRTVDVHRPTVKDGIVELHIELEDVTLRGSVVTERGDGVAQAELVLFSTPDQRVTVETDEDGHYELHGIEARSHWMKASHPNHGRSEWLEVDTTAGGETQLAPLVLKQGHEIEAVLWSAQRQPVSGARIHVYFPLPVAGVSTRTSVDGTFRIEVPEGAHSAMVQVDAPSQMLWAGCVQLPPSGPLEIILPPLPAAVPWLRVHGDTSLPPPTGGEMVLLSQPGGFLEHRILIRGPIPELQTDDYILRRSKRLASGTYALARSQVPRWQLAAQSCLGGAPPGLDWVTLGPGSQDEIPFDNRPHQRRAGDR